MNVSLAKRFNRQKRTFRRISDRDAIDVAIEKFFENPANPGLSLERLDKIKARNIWSVRVNNDIRIILYRSDDEWVLLHVDRHDEAYDWAERLKRAAPNPVTGAFQIVHTEEVYEQHVKPTDSALEFEEDASLFAASTDGELLDLGLPEEALPAVRKIAHSEQLIELIDIIPEAVWERLEVLARGEIIQASPRLEPEQSPLDHPDTRREIVVVEDDEELRQILDADWEEWLTFLHPTQHAIAYGSFTGPNRVTGSAGTGKTVVAMHRAKHLASQGKKVLLTTFTTTLANNLKSNLERLCPPGLLSRVTVSHVHGVARKLLESAGKNIQVVDDRQLENILGKAARGVGSSFAVDFLLAEWSAVIEEQGICTWDDYRVAIRKGRGTPLRVRRRKEAWKVFERVRETLHLEGRATYSGLCRLARLELEKGSIKSPWDTVIVDEVQDLGAQEILLLRAISGTGPDSMMVTGDSGQRIYPGGRSLTALRIETRGRSFVLRVNYRSSLEIKEFADRILSEETDDLDEGKVSRTDTISLFRGPEPEVHRLKNAGEQTNDVVRKIKESIDAGMKPGAIAVFVRTNNEIDHINRALQEENLKTLKIKENSSLSDMDRVRLGTMHRAKGLEFRTVFVVGVRQGNLPQPKALENLDGEELEVARERERNLLYVAVTRARDSVHIYYYGRPSPFLDEAGLLEKTS